MLTTVLPAGQHNTIPMGCAYMQEVVAKEHSKPSLNTVSILYIKVANYFGT